MYVSVLKIFIVHADGTSKSLRQKISFSRERPLLVQKKILYFTTISKNRAHQSKNEDNFSNFPLRLEFLNEAEKEKKNIKRKDLASPSRFASLSEDEMQQILTARKTLW